MSKSALQLALMAFLLAMACNPLHGYEFITRTIGVVGFVLVADRRWNA